jgi:hypothetical protein
MVKVTFLIMTTAKVPPDPPNMFRDHERSPLKRFARPPELLKDEEYELTATAPRNSCEGHVNSEYLATLKSLIFR